MMKTIPLRRTTRHLAQRLRMEGETFIIQSPYWRLVYFDSQRSDYTGCISFRLYLFNSDLHGLQNSQDERISFGDSDGMFKVRCQRTICRYNRPLIR